MYAIVIFWPVSISISFFFLDKGMFMTIAVDLVIAGIQEPVRFVVETKVRIFPASEKFWYYMHNKKPVHETFYLVLEEVSQ